MNQGKSDSGFLIGNKSARSPCNIICEVLKGKNP